MELRLRGVTRANSPQLFDGAAIVAKSAGSGHERPAAGEVYFLRASTTSIYNHSEMLPVAKPLGALPRTVAQRETVAKVYEQSAWTLPSQDLFSDSKIPMLLNRGSVQRAVCDAGQSRALQQEMAGSHRRGLGIGGSGFLQPEHELLRCLCRCDGSDRERSHLRLRSPVGAVSAKGQRTVRPTRLGLHRSHR